MIYNFNNISPKFDKESWYAPNSVLIGDVTLKKMQTSGLMQLER